MSQRGVVGVAAALNEAGRQAGGVHRPADRRPAAVHDDRPHADRFHEHDVDQQVPQGVDVVHHAAAELDDRDLVAELADPAQRFDQHVGFFGRGQLQGRYRGYEKQRL